MFIIKSIIFAVTMIGFLYAGTAIVDRSLDKTQTEFRKRFPTTSNSRAVCSDAKKRGVTLGNISRSFELDSIYFAAPGNEFAIIHYLTSVNFNVIHQKTSLTFIGRTGINNLKIRHTYSATGFSSAPTERIKDLEFFIEKPDSATTLRIEDFSNSGYKIMVTLDGSDIFYKVIGDWISPE